MRPSSTQPLVFPDDPGFALAEFEQLLVSNSGEEAFDVAIQLLTAKVFDEHRHAASGKPTDFLLEGSPEAVHSRVSALYKAAVAEWPELRSGSTTIDISPEQLVRCMRPLLGWNISESDLAHLDAVLERLVAKDAKGSLGQYFTPRDVVRMCVVALNPTGDDLVIDPACGSGAFLYEAIQYARKRKHGVPQCLGIDLAPKAVRVASLLAHAISADSLHIHRGNSIDGRQYSIERPPEWKDFLDSPVSPDPDKHRWGTWHHLRCSVLLTNPPFAGDLDDPQIIAAYESQRGRGASRKGTVGREHLFVERAVNLLAPGGRLAIVVPQGLLANSTSSYLRAWLLARCRVLAVVGLHPFAFLPYTGVKASILFLEKPSEGLRVSDDYNIAFLTSRHPGKDSSGRRTGSSDYDSLADSLGAFFAQENFRWADRKRAPMGADAETVPYREVATHDRLDAEYYDHDVRMLLLRMQARSQQSIGDHVSRSIGRFNRAHQSEIDYVDISSVDARSGLSIPNRIDAADAPSRASYLVLPGDVLVSTVRPDRNVVALINKTGEIPTVASNGFCLLRGKDTPPELLFAFCKTAAFRRLLTRRSTASMYPASTDRDVLDIPFVEPRGAAGRSIVQKIRSGLRLMADAQTAIAEAVAEMERQVEGVQGVAAKNRRGTRARAAAIPTAKRTRPGRRAAKF